MHIPKNFVTNHPSLVNTLLFELCDTCEPWYLGCSKIVQQPQKLNYQFLIDECLSPLHYWPNHLLIEG